jgi:uncharacterized repeat protein (TIGR01451 family)
MLNIYSSDVQVLDSVVKGSGDAGIVVMNASPVISASQFLSNTGDYGGGVYIFNGSPIIQNNIFTGNLSVQGGGLYSAYGDPLILNNLFFGNTAENGGGLYIDSGNAMIRNNIVVSNTASSGGGIRVAGGAPRLDYNDVWSNAGGDYEGFSPGAHDISADPLLADLANGDLHLTSGSLCIDAGDPDHHSPTDLEGDPRPMGLAPDIGPDEFRTLGVVKASTSKNAYPGAPVTYTINVVNGSSITLTNVHLTDILPIETAFTGYQADDLLCTHDGSAWGGLLHCVLDGASLAAGESRTLTMTVKLTEMLSWHQYITNTVALTADAGEDTLAAQDYAPTWINWCRVFLNDIPMDDDLQGAIDASTHITDVVKVSGYCFKHDLHLDKTLTLQGGWKWDFSEQNTDVYTTTLDAQKLGRVIQVQGYFTPTIDGFVITGGEDSSGAIFRGAGLFNQFGSPLILDNTFTGNSGNGLGNDMGNPIIQNNIFSGNSGYGLSNGNGSPTIQNNAFTGNLSSGLFSGFGNPTIQNNTFASNLGDGLFNASGSPIIQNNTFIGNDGDGLGNAYGNPTIINNTFTGNSGCGLYNWGGNPIVQNNTFTSNLGGGLYNFSSYPPVLDYNDVWNNTGGDYLGVAPGVHDISADPLLVDPAHGDFHLAPGSPCIDAGDPVNYPPTDFEGDPRPQGLAPDIGADEYRSPP